MRRWHLLVGFGTLVAFLASGQYMAWAHDPLPGLDDAPRLLFRSTHIYLLFAALLNIVLGLYGVRGSPGWRQWMRRLGSLLLLAAPPLVAAGFLTEPWLSGLERPFSRPAIIACLAGALLHAGSRWPQRE